VASEEPSALGEIIRRQRELSAMSMRQFAELVGISNPYLSQIERGLREPSERVLESIATALRTTSDALYEQAGIEVSAPEDAGPSVVDAIKADPRLNAAQRRAMLAVYQAFTEGPRRRRPPADEQPEEQPEEQPGEDAAA
jgi:transcriptional regulator with XRE-family HTH domain